METKIMKALKDVLTSFEGRYYIKNVLNKAKVIQDIDRYDEALIMALLNDETVKKHYSKQIGEYTIIETNKLIETFEMDDYWMDSYTKYSKKIGLTVNSRFLDESTDVILDFPYKDTILKAGMSKEDVEKEDLMPNEPFYNEVIAAEEIDTLMDKKILVNAKRYTANGVEDAVDFDEEDNLILKGNNLLALHSLKEKYAGKVKLIYIDPPYNTGNDSFQYNDRFNHSSWLTFMKNRLEIANSLLSDSGSILINIDYTEVHYLKIIADSIFGRENFVSDIIWKNNEQSKGYDNQISLHHNNLLFYKKSNFSLNLLTRTDKDNINYHNPDNDPNGLWRASDVRNSAWRPNLQYPIQTPRGNIINHPDNGWRFSKETFEKELKEGKIKFNEDETKIIRKIYLKDQKGRVVESVWNTSEVGTTREANSEIKHLFGNSIFATPKPERLIQRIIQISSDEKDLVLDFFMGSATTQAVAMKMNRRFIGIEQMDYINTVSVPRLQKVMEGEQGGISKEVNWQGGGSFVYAELMEKSKGYLQGVLEADDTDSLKRIYQLMLENVDLDFRVDLEQVQEMLNDAISLEEKKRILIKVIDKNQLYYNYSEMDDRKVHDLISAHDYAFNQSFYREEDGYGEENI